MRPGLIHRTLCAVLALLPLSALAVDPATTDAQRAQVESLRAEIADQLQLQAYDLLDELVYGWTQRPPFPAPVPVVLADVSVPVGFGSGLQALIENHLAGLVIDNPRSHLILAHCPQCTAVVVHSGAQGTVVSRGVDQPEALAKSGGLAGARHALFLDFEAEGAALVLRARITSLEPTLPIVFARTLSTTTGTPALLRSSEKLKSAEEARQEYLEALQGRGSVTFPVRVGVRTYAPTNRLDAVVTSVPFVWLTAGVELGLTQARAWTAGLSAGVSWMPDQHTGYLVQGRVARLITGNTTSLTGPDLYLFLGAAILSIHGQSALVFGRTLPTTADVLGAATGVTHPEATFAAFQLGLELRVKNRIAIGVFVEDDPALSSAPSIGRYLDLGFIALHSFGAEVSFCF